MAAIHLMQALSQFSSAPAIAKQLAAHGRGNDTLLAHISPKEALILKRLGGSGTRNPVTGLLEFDDSGDFNYNWSPDYSLTSGTSGGSGPGLQPSAPSGLGLQPTPSPSSSGGGFSPDYSLVGQSPTGTSPDGTGLQVSSGAAPGAGLSLPAAPSYPSFSPSGGSFSSGGGATSFSPSSGGFNPNFALSPSSSGTDMGGAGGLNFAASNMPGLSMPGAAASPGLQATSFNTQAQSPDQAVTGQPTQGVDAGTAWKQTQGMPNAQTNESNQPGFLSKLGTGLAGAITSPGFLTKLLGAGVGGVAAGAFANRASNQAAQQAQGYKTEYNNLASPLQVQGQNLIAMGQSGQLLPSQQQALAAQRARMQQQMANSGVTSGTAQQQMESILQNQAQQYSQNLVNQGLQMLGIGDQYAAQGIQAEYQANTLANQLSAQFAQQLGQILSGVFAGGQQSQQNG